MAQTLGNRGPQPNSGAARGDTSNTSGGSQANKNDRIRTSQWRILLPGQPYTVTIGGVDYSLTASDTYTEIP
jgi:hypothetical protein